MYEMESLLYKLEIMYNAIIILYGPEWVLSNEQYL